MDETARPNPPGEEQGHTTSACSHVCNKAPLAPYEIERICKAFIKLLLAKETQPNNGNGNKSDTDVSVKTPTE